MIYIIYKLEIPKHTATISYCTTISTTISSPTYN